MRLVPCESCGRHLRASESGCPFCGAAREACASEHVESGEGAPVTGRAQIMFGAVVGAVAISTALFGTGCPAYGAPVPAYGAPIEDSGVDAESPSDDAGQDAASAALYGGPPAPSE